MDYHKELKGNIHLYIKSVYKITKKFPRDELFGITSQFKRSSMSVMLNYIEGFARRKGNGCKVYKNFLEISYGSLKESEYLIYFSYTEDYITKDEYEYLAKLADKIGGMLWGILNKIN